jgi:hypothetical protein
MIYLISFEEKSLLVRAKKEEQASAIAFHALVDELDVDPQRLCELGYPSEMDVQELPELENLCSPVILEG